MVPRVKPTPPFRGAHSPHGSLFVPCLPATCWALQPAMPFLELGNPAQPFSRAHYLLSSRVAFLLFLSVAHVSLRKPKQCSVWLFLCLCRATSGAREWIRTWSKKLCSSLSESHVITVEASECRLCNFCPAFLLPHDCDVIKHASSGYWSAGQGNRQVMAPV